MRERKFMKVLDVGMSEEEALRNVEEAKVKNSTFKHIWELKTNTLYGRVWNFWKHTPWILEVRNSGAELSILELENKLEEAFGLRFTKNNFEGRWQRVRNFVGFKTEEDLEGFKKLLTKVKIGFD